MKLHLIDPKLVELADYADIPHVEGNYFTDCDDALRVFEETVGEIRHRNEIFRSKGPPTPRNIATFNSQFPDEKIPRWLLIIDEYADLMLGANRQTKNEMERCIQRICALGRSTGIHLIMSTQKASAQVVPTLIRDNFQARLALKVADLNASTIILGCSGAETITGKGEAIYRDGSGVKKRIQVAMC